MSEFNEACAVPVADHVEQFWRYLETEQVRILVDLQRDGYCDSSSFNDEVGKALLAERNAARSTISEQEKRIAELEAERDDVRIRAHDLFSQKVELEQALTSERQRREGAEAALRPFVDVSSVTNNSAIINKKSTDLTPLHFTIVLGQWRMAHAHFRKYEPGK